MITIFCGEDTITARSLYIQSIEKYKLNNIEVLQLNPSDIGEINRGLADTVSLFSSERVFCVENLEKNGFKKSTKTKKDIIYEALNLIAANKSITLLDFEEGKQARLLKLKDIAKVYESKPATSIFKLLDECLPGGKSTFINSLRVVCETQDEMFVFIMLYRHIRQLVLFSQGASSSKIPPWQKYKIMDQVKKWNNQSLLDFYSGLIKIEISSKTSSNPYGIQKSLEILACHYL